MMLVLEESDYKFQDLSRAAFHSFNGNAKRSNEFAKKQCQRRYSLRLLFLVIAFLLGVSTNNRPLGFAEARPPTRTTTTFSPTRQKAFLNSRAPLLPLPSASASASASALSSSQTHPLYSFGNFGHLPKPVSISNRLKARICNRFKTFQEALLLRGQRFLQQFLQELTFSKLLGWAMRAARMWVFWFFSKDCLSSIYEDRWHAERDPDTFFGAEGMWVSKGAHKDVVKRRIQRSRRNRQWVGLGYTPRLVWLVGVLLRGTFQCTAIPKVFNPSMTGWGAGTILGAKCTHQEWIATFMIGWFGSEYYWKYLFGCRGPPFAEPGFTGIPVFITKIRDVRL